MNLNACTPEQRDIVSCVDRPLLVSAGAGSGKTFTLTQRIAYALTAESGPAVSSIDEVLAITFTEKAAAEIKARVKRALRAEGGRLAEEALKVDGAWISTIHGMCARILRAHALDLGIDPAFGILGEAERADLVAAAIDEALGQDDDLAPRGFGEALFAEFAARSTGPRASSVAGMLNELLSKAANLRGGLDAVDFGPAPERPSALARKLLLAYEDATAAIAQAKPSAASQKAALAAGEAVCALAAFIDEHGGAEGREASPADWRAFARTLDRCAFLPATFGGAEVKAGVRACQGMHGHAAQQTALALALPAAEELMELARRVARSYEDAKRALCKLDNDDLLIKTFEAFEARPDIARRYERRFKLVMVDEFQDTSQLQIDMIARLAGEGCAHLCTVGDAQQSIYRFRGADVNVYDEHKRAMREPEAGARYVELSKNFRSHRDVLSFVDRVFEQPHVFGKAFMSLDPHEERPSSWQGSVPRIDVVLASLPSGKNTGVHTDDAKRASARELARRFAALRADGHAPGDMVVLLGAMTRADLYADALRSEGFECVIAGGSLFSSVPEVRVVGRLLQAVANPANTAALFEVLTSDMVRLSADDFLELSTEEDPESGRARRRDLDRGFARLAEKTDELPPRLAHAVRLITDARREARTLPASKVAMNAIVRSGWMARLEGEGACGLATAANVLKAVRMVESMERERHLGFASAAQAFARELEAAKEAPGALSGADGSVVKIMTVHASKGLEFPIVGLAEFAGTGRGSRLVVETCGSLARASLGPGRSLEALPGLAKAAKKYEEACKARKEMDAHDAAAAARFVEGDAAASCSTAAYREALKERAAREELAEARRKLYVGLTRASEALVVVMDAKEPAQGGAYPELVDDVRGALFGDGDFPEGVCDVDFGGTEPARFERVRVEPEGEEGVDDDSAAQTAPAESTRFTVPALPMPVPACEPGRAGREHVFSYSSIAPDPASGPLVSDGAHRATPSPDDACGMQDRKPEGDRAVALGNAFHRAAQFAVETGRLPGAARIVALSRAFGLSSDQCSRLERACARWFASRTFAEVLSWPHRRAEAPFFVRVDEALMEGEIDLLCTRPDDSSALVVDYKTGGGEDETPAQIKGKHLLQAQCYAYALLSQGFSSVDLRFERVEHDNGEGGLQEARYRFHADDVGKLEDCIRAARALRCNL